MDATILLGERTQLVRYLGTMKIIKYAVFLILQIDRLRGAEEHI